MNELLDFMVMPERFSFSPQDYQYFHQLLDKRTIIFNTDIDENIVESVYLPLREFEHDSKGKVTLILHSSGGCVTDGFFLANYIATYSAPLDIYVLGYAASMAAVILCAGGKNPNVTRYCYPSTYALIHDGYIALKSSETKTAEDIMNYNKKVDGQIRQFIIDNTRITPEQYDAQTRHQWFIGAEEMKELNIVDVILDGDESK